MNSNDVGFKLKKSCDDCPFKRTSPLHSGVMRDLPHYDEQLKKAGFAHTCHKNDSRSDGYVEQYSGQVQHCFGALAFFANLERSAGDEDTTPDGYPATQTILYYALAKGGIQFEEMVDPDVFTSMSEMKDAYRPMIEEEARKIRVHVSYANGERKRFIL